jgi:hypothetical protein
MNQTIDLRAASGGVEYTWPLTITEATGKDISGDTIELSLGSYNTPGTWRAPDTDTGTGSTRTVQLLIGTTLRPLAGNVWLWSRVTDSPELVPRRHEKIVILADPT